MIFNPVIATFFLLLFISGYVLYSAIFALVASIVNSDKEAQNFILPIILPLLVSFLVSPAIGDDPNATWVLFLCFFPLTAPTTQMSRIAIMAPSAQEYSIFSGILGEALLTFLIIVAAAIGLTWLTARVFRVGILMYGKRPTFSEIIRWIRH
jgi:ABC-2 type transport system permease protein